MKSVNNIIIGIDTSCYTTSIAAISLDKKVIFNEKIMLEVRENTKGLRQSEAVFQHVNNLGLLSDRVKSFKDKFNIEGVCSTIRPRPVENSYMPVFNVGYNFGKLLSSIYGCRFYETTHQENHIEASLLNSKLKNNNRFISVHMSGGTTEILLINKMDDNYNILDSSLGAITRISNKKDDKSKLYNNFGYNIDIIGGSKDISFGQLIDRVGVKLGYKFPSGKYLDENALNCNFKIESGLKTSVRDGYMNLSGLENQVNKIIKDNKDNTNQKEYVSKLVLDSVVRNMFKSLVYLCETYNVDEVVFAGGVSASRYILKELSPKLRKKHIEAHFTEPQYSTDNAVGCAIIGLNNFLGERV
ncbi:O-sialoglycoprotein endopeptidase [Clostridioides difficile]|nr:O-sialoglycoprotein endopeptidase [Clostridioides difficile]